MMGAAAEWGLLEDIFLVARTHKMYFMTVLMGWADVTGERQSLK